MCLLGLFILFFMEEYVKVKFVYMRRVERVRLRHFWQYSTAQKLDTENK